MTRVISIFVIVIGAITGVYFLASLTDGIEAPHWKVTFAIIAGFLWVIGNILVIVQLVADQKLFQWKDKKRY